MAEDAKVVFGIEVDDSGVDRSLDAVGRKVKSGAGKWESMVSGIWQGVGQRVGQGLISAATSGIKAVFKLGTEFETSMAKASTLIDTTQHDMKQLGDSILEVSTRTGVAASELGDAMYSALSASIPLGEDGADMMLYLERCAMLAKAGFTDVDTAVTATAKVLNAYGLDVAETDRVQRVLMQTQNLGITTVGELGSVLAQVTPTAAAFGLSFEQVGASLATMTAAGTPTAQAVTQLRQLLVELGKEGTQASKALKASTRGTEWADMSFTELLNTGMDLNQILSMMRGYADGAGVSMLDLFGSVEAGNAALALSGDHSETFISNLAAMSTETDVVGEAFEKVTDTSSERWNKFTNALGNVGIQLWDGMAPAIEAFTTWISSEETLASIRDFGNALSSIFMEIHALISGDKDLLDEMITSVVENPRLKKPKKAVAEVADAYMRAMLPDTLEPDVTVEQMLESGPSAYRLARGEHRLDVVNPDTSGTASSAEAEMPVPVDIPLYTFGEIGSPVQPAAEAAPTVATPWWATPASVNLGGGASEEYVWGPIGGATETQSAQRVYGPALPEDDNWGMTVPYDQPIEQATVEAANVELIFPGQPGWQQGAVNLGGGASEEYVWGPIGESTETLTETFAALGDEVTGNTQSLGDMKGEVARMDSEFGVYSRALDTLRGNTSGLASATGGLRGALGNLASAAQAAVGKLSSLAKTDTSGSKGAWDALGKSVGLNYVPYDEYPALLHKGEMVLTAAEASAYNLMQAGRMGGGGIDYDQLAASMASLQISMDGRRVGQLTERGVSAAQAARYSRVTRSGGM